MFVRFVLRSVCSAVVQAQRYSCAGPYAAIIVDGMLTNRCWLLIVLEGVVGIVSQDYKNDENDRKWPKFDPAITLWNPSSRGITLAGHVLIKAWSTESHIRRHLPHMPVL